jgi:integrase
VNPCDGVELPAPQGRRDRIAAPEEAAQLLAALPEGDRALWATAVYAGLRRGELMALDWTSVDLAGGTIAVERSFDPKEGVFVEVKSRAGERRVPLAGALREHLIDHKLRTRSTGLVFGRDGERPFDHSGLRARAARAWRAAGLAPITLHEGRHTFASLMIAAGVGAKALSSYMGHAGIQITLDRYGHLMPGNEVQAAGLLDAYLARADTAARLAQLEGAAESAAG